MRKTDATKPPRRKNRLTRDMSLVANTRGPKIRHSRQQPRIPALLAYYQVSVPPGWIYSPNPLFGGNPAVSPPCVSFNFAWPDLQHRALPFCSSPKRLGVGEGRFLYIGHDAPGGPRRRNMPARVWGSPRPRPEGKCGTQSAESRLTATAEGLAARQQELQHPPRSLSHSRL